MKTEIMRLWYRIRTSCEDENDKQQFILFIKDDFNETLKTIFQYDEFFTHNNFKILTEITKEANVCITNFINAIISFSNKQQRDCFFDIMLDIVKEQVEELTIAIIDAKNFEYMYRLAKDRRLPNTQRNQIFNAILELNYNRNTTKLTEEDVICNFILTLNDISEELVKTIIDIFVKQNKPLNKLTDTFIKKTDLQAFRFYLKHAPRITIDYLKLAFVSFLEKNIIIDSLIDDIIDMDDLEYSCLVLRVVPNLSKERVYKLVTIVVKSFNLNSNTTEQAILRISSVIANNVITQQNIDQIWLTLLKISLTEEKMSSPPDSQFDGDETAKRIALT